MAGPGIGCHGPQPQQGPTRLSSALKALGKHNPPKTAENIQFRVVGGPLGSEAQSEKKPPKDQRGLAAALFHPLRVSTVSQWSILGSGRPSLQETSPASVVKT